MSDQPISRRDLLKAGASLAVTGFAGLPNIASAQDGYPTRNLSQLANYSFKGQDGKPVDVSKLLQNLKGRDATLTFGFQRCTAYCPFTNGTLGAMDEKASGRFTHIVIAMDPEHDGKTADSRKHFIDTVKDMMNYGRKKPLDGRNLPNNVIILYPPSGKDGEKIEKAFDNLVGDIPKEHTPNVDVFNATGKRIAKGVPESVPAKDDSDLASKAQTFASTVMSRLNGKGR